MRHKKRGLPALLAAVAALASAICIPAQGQAAGEEPGFEKENAGESALPMDPSVMSPWINSNVIGMVTETTAADVKDDFYLAVNRDWMLSAGLRPGYTSESPLHATLDLVKDRCEELLTDTGTLHEEEREHGDIPNKPREKALSCRSDDLRTVYRAFSQTDLRRRIRSGQFLRG